MFPPNALFTFRKFLGRSEKSAFYHYV